MVHKNPQMSHGPTPVKHGSKTGTNGPLVHTGRARARVQMVPEWSSLKKKKRIHKRE